MYVLMYDVLTSYAVALYLLYLQVNLALLAGLGVIMLLIPINMLLTKKISSVSQ